MTRRGARRTRPAALIALALVTLAGCGNKPDTTKASSSPSPAASQSPTTSTQATSPAATPQSETLPVYYVADQPRGPRLFREFRSVEVSGTSDRISAALKAALSNLALDPDYRTDWPAGTSVISAEPSGSAIAVDLTNSGVDLTARPANVTDTAAQLAIQQLVYTVQAVTQKKSPVSFRIDGTPAQTLLGVQVPPIVNAEPPMKVQGTVWIIDPQDGDEVGGTFTATGRGAFFEATVPWQLLQGNKVVKQGVTMAQECCTLSPYSFTVRNVRPGDYVLRVYDADMSGVEGGRDEPADTKRITVN
jgi:spore germination protein GerM